MMTLIGRICAMCAMNALADMILPEEGARMGMRVVCGLLMLRLALEGGQELVNGIMEAKSLGAMLGVLAG